MLFSQERLNRKVHRMNDDTVVSLNTPQDPLTELIRQGARDLIAQAVEAELQQLLDQHQNLRLCRKFFVRHHIL